MTPEIREYARKEILNAKLNVIKRAMEPVEPTDKNPFPGNTFHQWNEKVKKSESYEQLVDQRFMGIITIEGPGFGSDISLEAH